MDASEYAVVSGGEQMVSFKKVATKKINGPKTGNGLIDAGSTIGARLYRFAYVKLPYGGYKRGRGR